MGANGMHAAISAANSTTQVITRGRSCLSEKRPIGICSNAPPIIATLITSPTPPISNPNCVAYTGVIDQNAPIASPDNAAEATAKGAKPSSARRLLLGRSDIFGCTRRVSVMGNSAQLIKMAMMTKSKKPCGEESRSSCCAVAKAPRLTTI